MVPFLQQVAKRILEEHQDTLEQVYVVLPNRRAGLFLKKQLALQMQKPFFAPKITSIEDFVVELTDMQIEDPIYLLFSLYQIHLELESDRMLTFSEFAKFGEMLLHDFNTIDSNLADAKTVFTWLSEEKAISLWNVDGQELTSNQKSYLRFYSLLYTYYERLNAFCSEKNKNYQGHIYRIATENIQQLSEKIKTPKIWIVGFNALTKSEYRILHYLERSGKAEILWDADMYYMESDIQESGYFLRKYKSAFDSLNDFSDCFKEPKEIEIVGVSENIIQAKYAGQKVKQLIEKAESPHLENTAIVLADESLLLPVLNSLPSNLDYTNVTMGYAFRLTSVYDLGYKLLQLHHFASSGSKAMFNRQNVIAFLSHNYWQKLSISAIQKSKICKELSSLNKSYISSDEIQQLCLLSEIDFEILSPFFSLCNEASELFLKFDLLIQLFWNETENDLLEPEFLYTFHKLNSHLKEIQKQYNSFTTIESILAVYTALANRMNIPFYGEPLKGLQIMGLLETRCIDFENLIVLSVNEGILPRGKTTNSLLPFQIKKEFEIPSYNENDSIYAYHFYRLLQRAKKITLMYNNDSEGFGKNEKSRFIKQLQMELKQYCPETQITETSLTSSKTLAINDNMISISKNETILDRLKAIAENEEKGFSPSALNCYISCSLKFYFTYVLKIPEIKETDETIDSAILGTVIHAVMEVLFNPETDSDRYISFEMLEKFKEQIPAILIQVFDEKYHEGNLQTGKNRLIFEIVQKMILAFIEKQQEVLQNSTLEILGLEQKLHSIVEITTSAGTQKINMSGTADRIDKLNGVLRIIDYKSGKVSDQDLILASENLDAFVLEKIPAKSFQLLFYSWIYNRENKAENLLSGIYSFLRVKDELLTAKVDGTDTLSKSELHSFESFLLKLVEEIFDREKPFEQTANEKTCSYCQFATICGK